MTDKSESILHSLMQSKSRLAKRSLTMEGSLPKENGTDKKHEVVGGAESLGKRGVVNGKEIFAKMFSGKKKVKQGAEFDVEKYAKMAVEGSKLPKLVLEEGMMDNSLIHFELESEQLKKSLTTERPEDEILREEQARQAESAKKQAANKFLVIPKKSTLLDDDYDDIDDNQIAALNNDVTFKDYRYKDGINVKKQKFAYEGLQLEFTPRLPEFSDLKLYEFPSLHDNLMEYLEKLTEEDGERGASKVLGCLATFRLLCSYKDYFHVDPFCVESYAFKKVSVLHAVNHILQSSEQPEPNNGFTGCRVVFVLPFRIDCVEIVEILAEILGEGEASSVEKFYDSYASPEVGILN